MKKYMKYFYLSAIVVASVIATTVHASSLIKGASFNSVYYLGDDGKRYVFTNEKVFHSWYADFTEVTTIPDTQLYATPLGGNVTYKPGRLIKVETNPKVYAVDKGGVLRWVTSEALASQLFGADWNTKIDDVADVFFVNYSLGSPIRSATDFDPAIRVISISEDKTLTATLPTSVVDICKNIEGNQTVVPQGLIANDSGMCIVPSTTICTPNWQCGSWSNCTNSQQTRACSDVNSCNTTSGIPAITQSCTTSTQTPVSTKPTITSFTASKTSASIDDTITLTWTSENSVLCAITETNNIQVPFVGNLPNGSKTVTLKETANLKTPTFTYYIICADKDWNTAIKDLKIEVNATEVSFDGLLTGFTYTPTKTSISLQFSAPKLGDTYNITFNGQISTKIFDQTYRDTIGSYINFTYSNLTPGSAYNFTIRVERTGHYGVTSKSLSTKPYDGLVCTDISYGTFLNSSVPIKCSNDTNVPVTVKSVWYRSDFGESSFNILKRITALDEEAVYEIIHREECSIQDCRKIITLATPIIVPSNVYNFEIFKLYINYSGGVFYFNIQDYE